MALTKSPDSATTLARTWPSFTWPTWKWLDEVLCDTEGLQTLKIEELTEGDEYVVRAELPGIDPDTDVEVAVDDGILTISAHRSEATQRDDRQLRRSEFRYGAYLRSITIPRGVEADRVTATYKDGVLEVRVPGPTTATEEASHKVKVLHS